MNAGSSLGFPGGRTLAAWWRQLAGFQPQTLWIGYLTLVRLEALVCALRPQTLPPFELLVLKALHHYPATDAKTLGDFLHLAPNLVHRVLHQLQAEGLIEKGPGLCQVSENGRQAVAQGQYLRPRRERRSFYFWSASWRQPQPSRFVPLANAEKQPWLAAPEVAFQGEALHACLGQSPEWKRRHGFPQEVHEVLRSGEWENVILAAPQRLFAAVARTAAGDLAAMPVQTRNWELQGGQPLMVVPDEDWMPVPAENVWQQSLVDWCMERQLAPEEAAASALLWHGDRLTVKGPAAVEERIRAAKGEAWLLAGDGLVRAAARLEVG